jgi:hypothetical protein
MLDTDYCRRHSARRVFVGSYLYGYLEQLRSANALVWSQRISTTVEEAGGVGVLGLH